MDYKSRRKPGIKYIGNHYDLGVAWRVFETIITTKDHKIINRSNYEEELDNLIREMEIRRDNIFGSPSGWILKKLFIILRYI